MFQTTNVSNYQYLKLPISQTTNISNYQCSEPPMFQSINVPSYHATEQPCNKSKNQGARTKVLKPKCKSRRTRAEEREPKNKILGTKSSEQSPRNKVLETKSSKLNFWNKIPKFFALCEVKLTRNPTFGISFCIAVKGKQVVLLWVHGSALTKVTCRLLTQRSGQKPLFAIGKQFWKTSPYKFQRGRDSPFGSIYTR